MSSNRLIHEQSPYLLQHAHNPVDWQPWDNQAFARATAANQLIFLSIGYATCHWCHVMERESFEDDEVAALLGRDFVAIKVDREERPDIDAFYMQVATHLTGQGGWPLTIIMTPDKVPLFAATYLPKRGRMGRPGLLELLPQIAAAWADHPDRLCRDAGEFLARLAPTQDSAEFDPALIGQAVARCRAEFDAEHGGFGGAPKFPRPHQLGFLLQRHALDGDAELLQMVEHTLVAMRNGGIYDQLGFGFHRYATDRQWLLPHFEKMLYDQAGLAEVYLQAFQLSGKPAYAATAREIFRYLLERMRDPAGGFHSAEDADTDGIEGATYLWTRAELLERLGEERGARFAETYQVRDEGNFRDEATRERTGANILHRTADPIAPADTFEAERLALLRIRDRRPQPQRDDKILAAWNGLTLSALSRGALLLREERLAAAAEQLADFLLHRMRSADGHLLRRWRNGAAAIPAFAEDYAAVARGLLDLYQLDFATPRLYQAIELAEILFTEFAEGGNLYASADRAELPHPTCERYDGASPSAPSLALEVAGRLAQLSGDLRWQTRAEALLRGATPEVKRYPQGFVHLLAAAERVLGGGQELVIRGERGAADTQALLEAARRFGGPLLTLLVISDREAQLLAGVAPFTADMRMLDGSATAYLCRDRSCGRPIRDAAELAVRLKG